MKTIFVSSTFKDMHFERDAIQEIALPALKTEAIKYGESISFCDLRWGINTGDLDTEEGSRKVLDVCLDEIDRCKPPMVIILGDRYGWIPDEDLMSHATERKHIDKEALKADMQLEDLQISVTALEIAYGALSTPEKRNSALFYFRHIESECPDDYLSEDSEHKKKLDRLKAKIDELTGGRIKHYSVRWDGEKLDGVIEFAEMLAEDIKTALLPEWKKKELLTPFERERLTHWSFIEEKNTMFSARSAMVQKFFDDLTGNRKNFLAIKAPSGSGKSMLFSNLALRFRDAGYDTLPFISGLTSESNDSVDILRNTIYYLEELLGFEHATFGAEYHTHEDSTESNGEQKKKTSEIDKLRERLLTLCLECEQANRKVIIMVDAVDQLNSDDNRDNLIFIPVRLSENVKFVMTCLPELDTFGREALQLQPINDDEKLEVIRGILNAHHRQIEDCVIEKMIGLQASDNPLYLSILIQRLLMMNRDDFVAINSKQGDAMKAISERQMEVIEDCPDSLQEMSTALLAEAGKRINSELVFNVAKFLSVSRHGLRAEDLAALLGDQWSSLDFAHFVMYMDESFIRRDDGRFDFAHKCIREGFLNVCKNTNSINKQLLNHFKSLSDEDTVKKQEIVYHCIQADDKDYFIDFVEKYADNGEQIGFAQKDVFINSIENNGTWICDVMLCEKKSFRLCQFINDTFIHGTPKQLTICQKILRANIDYAEANKEIFSIAMVSTAYNQYAYVCGELGGKENFALSLDYYLKSVLAAEEAEKEYPDLDLREFLALRYSNYAYTLSLFGGVDNYNQTVVYYQKAIKYREALYENDKSNYVYALNLASSYDSIGGLLSEFLSGNNQDNSIIYLEKALKIRNEFRDKIPTGLYINNIINSYTRLARLYHNKATIISPQDIRKSIEYYDKAIKLTESQKNSHNKAVYYIKYMNLALTLGNLYTEKDKGAYDAKKAAENFDKVIRIYNAIETEYITDNMKEHYAYALNGYGLLISLSNDKKKYSQAIEYYRDSIAIIEEFVERYQTSGLQTQLFTIYANCAMLCGKMKEKKFFELGIDYCHKALTIAKIIERSGQLTLDYHQKCTYLYSIATNLFWKQKKYIKSLHWLGYMIKSATGMYSFDVNK